MLASSSDSNYVPNEHEHIDQYGSFAIPSEMTAISKPSWKFGEPKWNPYWLIVLTSSSDSNYVPNEHEHIDKYDPFAIPFEIMPW